MATWRYTRTQLPICTSRYAPKRPIPFCHFHSALIVSGVSSKFRWYILLLFYISGLSYSFELKFSQIITRNQKLIPCEFQQVWVNRTRETSKKTCQLINHELGCGQFNWTRLTLRSKRAKVRWSDVGDT